MTQKVSAEDFEKILLDIYEQDEQEINSLHGGFPMHYCMRIEKCQSILWKEYRINRPTFLKLFAEFYDRQPLPRPTELRVVSVYGGTAKDFTKRSWVCIHGKKYILFQIRLEEYRMMRTRERYD